ncbi:MAG: hypothetical protein RBS56_03110 [Candidatus Gracilibacteria bacterium]|jgi:hypothetical protein|nr:hypothetical protein [Candidatus Gracilibacteria bacterium]
MPEDKSKTSGVAKGDDLKISSLNKKKLKKTLDNKIAQGESKVLEKVEKKEKKSVLDMAISAGKSESKKIEQEKVVDSHKENADSRKEEEEIKKKSGEDTFSGDEMKKTREMWQKISKNKDLKGGDFPENKETTKGESNSDMDAKNQEKEMEEKIRVQKVQKKKKILEKAVDVEKVDKKPLKIETNNDGEKNSEKAEIKPKESKNITNENDSGLPSPKKDNSSIEKSDEQKHGDKLLEGEKDVNKNKKAKEISEDLKENKTPVSVSKDNTSEDNEKNKVESLKPASFGSGDSQKPKVESLKPVSFGSGDAQKPKVESLKPASFGSGDAQKPKVESLKPASFGSGDAQKPKVEPLKPASFGSGDSQKPKVEPLKPASFGSGDAQKSKVEPLKPASFGSGDSQKSKVEPLKPASFGSGDSQKSKVEPLKPFNPPTRDFHKSDSGEKVAPLSSMPSGNPFAKTQNPPSSGAKPVSFSQNTSFKPPVSPSAGQISINPTTPFSGHSPNLTPSSIPSKEAFSVKTPDLSSVPKESVNEAPKTSSPITAEVVNKAPENAKSEIETFDDFDSGEGFFDVLAEAGISKSLFFWIVGGFLVIIIAIVFFIFGGYSLIFGKNNDTPSEDKPIVSESVVGDESSLIGAIDVGEVSSDNAYLNGSLSGVSASFVIGDEYNSRRVDLVYYLELLSQMQNVYRVDVYSYLDRNSQRRESLNDLLDDMRGLLEDADVSIVALNRTLNNLDASYKPLLEKRDNYENSFFNSVDTFKGSEAYDNLEFFIEFSQDAIAVKAYFSAYSSILDSISKMVSLLSPRYDDIVVNKEALIKGIRVFDIPESDIEAIIPLNRE